MPTSPNLELIHLEPHTNQQEVPANADFDQLDNAGNGLLSVVYASASITLTKIQALHAYYYRCTGILDADRDLIVPDNKKTFFMENGAGDAFNITVKTVAGSGITVGQGIGQTLYCDGTNVVSLAPPSAITSFYDFHGYFPGNPTGSEDIFVVPVARSARFLAGLPSSRIIAKIAATAETIFSIRKNGGEFGTATFAVSGTVATLAAGSDTDFAAGDELSIVGPGTPDATIAKIGIALAGVRI
jgi:hypothetical protein